MKGNEFVDPPCSSCALREVVFKGSNVVERFCQWLFHPQHKDVIAIAHNAKAYDAYFLYSYIVRSSLKPNIIFSGSKIMYCHVKSSLNIKLLDSVNFLPMPLAKLPKSFDLKELKKGYFPHFMNTFKLDASECNLSHLPDINLYGPDNMGVKQRETFLKWYNEHRHDSFNFHQELLDYCRSDVNILLNACWKFRRLLIELTSIDPYQYMTIASVGMGVFRTCFYPEEWKVLLPQNATDGCRHDYLNCKCLWTNARKRNGMSNLEIEMGPDMWMDVSAVRYERARFERSTIALLPPQGYARRDTFSKMSLEWLHIFEDMYRSKIRIQTARSDNGEYRVSYMRGNTQRMYALDGFFVDQDGSQHALEFNGCYYHGCPRCFPCARDSTIVFNKSLTRRYQETMMKEETLRSMGYTVHSIWSCEYIHNLANSPEWQRLVKELELQDPIDIRDCYFGGRTNALVLSKNMLSTTTRAAYVDFCSLYPYVMKYRSYPIYQPRRITNNFEPLREEECEEEEMCPLLSGPIVRMPCAKRRHVRLPYFGIVKAKILPPRECLIPVLPFRCKGKLMFPLCAKCAVCQDHTKACICTDEDRCLVATWCSIEVDVALSVGYKLIKLYEVLHWDSKSDNLFNDYVNTFFKLKTEASGFPDDVVTDEEKKAFVDYYEKREGIRLDVDKVRHNESMRTIPKFLINVIYGKFGQNQNMKKTKIINHADELYEMLTNPATNVSDFHILHEDVMMVEYSQCREFQNIDPKTNVVISAFCSAYARIHLWQVMNQLGPRILYHDTDSVIYTYNEGEWLCPLGECLGDLTDELSCSKIGCSKIGSSSPCGGHSIVDFVSCGAKNYAYRLNTGESVCKVRGFSLNFTNAQVIRFDTMRKALFAWQRGESCKDDMTTTCTQILRHKREARVYSKYMKKQYNVVYDKRQVLPDFTTLPWGHAC
jgi:hypothetical protein